MDDFDAIWRSLDGPKIEVAEAEEASSSEDEAKSDDDEESKEKEKEQEVDEKDETEKEQDDMGQLDYLRGLASGADVTALTEQPMFQFASSSPPSSPHPMTISTSPLPSSSSFSPNTAFALPLFRGGLSDDLSGEKRMPGSTLDIDVGDFDPRTMNRDTPACFIGAIRSGKSKLITHILKVLKFERVMAFLGGNDGPAWYRWFIPDLYIHECRGGAKGWDSSILNEVLRSQEALLTLQTDFPDYFQGLNMELCILFEDLAFSKIFRTHEIFAEMTSNVRRLKIASFWSAQYANSFGTLVRGNFEYGFLFRVDQAAEQRVCHDMFGNGFQSKEHFVQVHNGIAEKHVAMVVLRTEKTNDLSVRIKKILAPPPPENLVKPDYCVGVNSIIAHELFYKHSGVQHPFAKYYRYALGLVSEDEKKGLEEAKEKEKEQIIEKSIVMKAGKTGRITIHPPSGPNLPPSAASSSVDSSSSSSSASPSSPVPIIVNIKSLPLPRPPPPASRLRTG